MLHSSRVLLDLGIPELDDRAFRRDGGQIKAYIGGGSRSAPSVPASQTVTQTNIPEWARPYAEEMLGNAQTLTDTGRNPFEPYQGQRFAGFSPMQAQAFQNVAGQQVAPQLTDASNLAYTSAQQGLGTQPMASGLQAQALQYGGLGSEYGALGALSAPQAQQYGAQGSGIGQMGVQAAQQGFGAGAQYAQQATSPEATQAYMSPYMQNVVEAQQREARRASEIQQQATQSQAAQQGAFGGSRSAILEAERQRNLGTQLGDIQATGLQRAYEQAQQAQQFGADLGLKGLQTGYSGLGVGLQGTETGLRGIETGLRGTAQGIQGAQAGMQGVGQAVGAGQYGLSGAQLGISGAGALGQLGQEQYAQEMGITDAMQKFGALQQGQSQQEKDFQYQQFLAQQQYPYQQLSYMSDLLRGVPSTQSAQLTYAQQPNQTAQLLGAGLGAYGAFGRRKEGGQVKKYEEGGQIQRYSSQGQVSPVAMSTMAVQELPSRLKRLSDDQLAAYARSVTDAITLSAVQSEMARRAKNRAPMGEMPQETVADEVVKRAGEASIGKPRVSMYGGGIVALQGGGMPEDEYNLNSMVPPPAPPVATANTPMQTPSPLSSFANYQAGAGQAQQTPEQQKLLADMQARIEKNIGRAESQTKDAAYDAILSAGLAMMGGTSLADGIARAAQTGGATYLAGKREANKAIDSAEQAELSFREYEMALNNQNQEMADKKFGDFVANTIRLQAATGGTKGSSNYDKALIRTQNDPFIKNAFAIINDNVASPEEKQNAINDLNERMRAIFEGFGVSDRFQPYNITPAQATAEEPGFFDRLFGSSNKTTAAEDPLSIR
jgi:hypothetical protein